MGLRVGPTNGRGGHGAAGLSTCNRNRAELSVGLPHCGNFPPVQSIGATVERDVPIVTRLVREHEAARVAKDGVYLAVLPQLPNREHWERKLGDASDVAHDHSAPFTCSIQVDHG